jgi:hypothetical protein
MAPQSNPALPPPDADVSSENAPSADDLLALIPDLDLLESSTIGARTASAAPAAASSNRKPSQTPVLSDRNAATATRQTSKPQINDDPYADLMPDPEELDTAVRVAPATPPIPAIPAIPAIAAIPATAAIPARPRAAPNARKMPNPQTIAVPPVMNRDYIVRNRIVELYLSGSLPIHGATQFERFCRENPQILDQIGLPERIHAGLQLLEAGGMPEPWREKPKKFWEQPHALAALAGLVLVFGSGMLLLNSRLSAQTRKAAALQQLVTDQPLDAAAASSTVDIEPSRSGPNSIAVTIIGGSVAQLVNIKLNVTRSDFRAFRVTIDRVNQGRAAVLNNLIKDSNGELGFSLNSSALGAGSYLLTIEGLDWRGDPQPDSWAGITIKH